MRTKLLLGGALLLLVASTALAQPSARQLFDDMKRLSGSWTGKDSLGHQAQITFRVASAGSVLLSELVEPNHQNSTEQEDMISMIHVDGDRLLLTHYCSAGNQPRMKATPSADGKTITFEFVDATNLSSPAAARMQRVVFRILAPDHHTEEWTFRDHGRESSDLFDLRRESARETTR